MLCVLLFDYDNLAGVDLCLQPIINSRDFGDAVDFLCRQHVHHAAVDGLDADYFGLLGRAA